MGDSFSWLGTTLLCSWNAVARHGHACSLYGELAAANCAGPPRRNQHCHGMLRSRLLSLQLSSHHMQGEGGRRGGTAVQPAGARGLGRKWGVQQERLGVPLLAAAKPLDAPCLPHGSSPAISLAPGCTVSAQLRAGCCAFDAAAAALHRRRRRCGPPLAGAAASASCLRGNVHHRFWFGRENNYNERMTPSTHL